MSNMTGYHAVRRIILDAVAEATLAVYREGMVPVIEGEGALDAMTQRALDIVTQTMSDRDHVRDVVRDTVRAHLLDDDLDLGDGHGVDRSLGGRLTR